MEQRTNEWLELRKTKVGASDAPIIMKTSPWKTPYQLWREKLGIADEPVSTYAMDRGNELEPIARRALEDKLGMPLQPKVMLHIERSWMMASMDAISFDERVIAEIKCPGKNDHEIALSGRVPEKYYPQLQHQMEVCGLDEAYYFSFHGDEGVLLKIVRDEDYIRRLIIEEEKFYQCMVNFEPPELTSDDYVWQDGARWAKIAERLAEIKQIKAEEESLKKELIMLANGMNSRGAGITLTKCVRKGTIDYKSIPELQGIDLESYRKESSEYWRLS
jgi:putative phage-type endonuclease